MQVVTIRLTISNAFLLLGRRPVLIDCGCPRDAARLQRQMERYGVQPGDLSLLLLSHNHFDHCGSAKALHGWSKAPVAIHPLDTARLRTGAIARPTPVTLTGRLIRPFVMRPYPGIEPDVALADQMRLDDYGIDGAVYHTPGHTAGSVSVLLDDGRAIVGDLIMGGFFGGKLLPRLPGYEYYAEDLDAVHCSLQRLLDLGAAEFFVGHGGPLTRHSVIRRFARSLEPSRSLSGEGHQNPIP